MPPVNEQNAPYIFLPIAKIDVEKRLVYGRITAEVVDKSGEIMDYEGSKAAFQAWSDEISKNSGGKSKGNLREMHGKSAVGKFDELTFNDADKDIWAVAKVVDDPAWNKCLEGVYSGFSIGGNYAKRWDDPNQPGVTRFIPVLNEVSLVDNPCVPNATFELLRADGQTELVKIKGAAPVSPTPATAVAKTDEPVKQVWLAKDDSQHATKRAAALHNLDLDAAERVAKLAAPATAAVAALAKDVNGEEDPAAVAAAAEAKKAEEAATAGTAGAPAADAPAAADAADAPKADLTEAAAVEAAAEITAAAADKAADGKFKKGMYSVSRLACLIDELGWLQGDTVWEAMFEGDASEVPAQLKAAIGQLCEVLKAMVTEEADELIGAGEDVDVVELAAGIRPGAVAAVSKMLTDPKFAKMLTSFKATAEKAATPAAAPVAKADTSDEPTALEKAASMEKAFGASVTTLTDAVTKLQAQVAVMERQPLPARGVRAVSKAADGTGDGTATNSGADATAAMQAHLAKLTPEQRTLELIKLSHLNPVPLIK